MINFKKSDIQRIIKEGIEEIRSLGGNSSAGAQSQTATAQATPNHTGTKAKFPSLKYAYYEPDANGNYELIVGIQWIHNQHQNILAQKWAKEYSNIFTTKLEQSSDDSAPKTVEFHVLGGQEDAFKQILPNIKNDILSLNGKNNGKYDASAATNFEAKIISRIDDAPTKDDLDKADARKVDTTIELLTKLKDPNTLKIMGNIGGVVNITHSKSLTDLLAGHQLSKGNQAEVYFQLFSAATFVTDSWTWEHVFNREVIDRQKFAIIRRPKNNKPQDLAAWNRAAKQCGYANYDDFKRRRKYGSLSPQQIFAVEALANIYNTKSGDFYGAKVYDYSNTRLLPGKTQADDVFNNTPGLADNLKGMPNQPALDADANAAAKIAGQQQQQPVTQAQFVNRSSDEIAAIIEFLRSKCMQQGISIGTVRGNMGDQIIHAVKEYSKHFILPNNGGVKPEFTNAFCEAMAFSIAATYGIETPAGVSDLQKYLNAYGKTKDLSSVVNLIFAEYKRLVTEINNDLRKQSNKMVKMGQKVTGVQKQAMEENVDEEVMESGIGASPMNFNQFLNVLGLNQQENAEIQEEVIDDTEAAQQIKESFFRLLDKMENLND